SFDTGDSTFNAFALADLALNPPYLLQVVKPHVVESDIVIDVSKNSLTVDLGDLKELFEHSSKKLGNVLRSPDLGFGIKQAFIGVMPEIEARNRLDLDHNLHSVLADAAPFTPNTTYGVHDVARAQAAIAFYAGTALPLLRVGGD